ncbi:MAG: SirB2 family protein [Pseudomonadota bacterium]|nr:SirB2 family protein [Pseudomonadota bacterium]
MVNNIELFNLMKIIHMVAITITILGFILRGIWMIKESPMLKKMFVRILPHANDTILVISALWTGALINQYPFVNSWLTAKTFGLLGYIVCATIALNYGKTKRIRIQFFISGLMFLSYTIWVASEKNPLPFI